jgi:hypothetical protein
VTPNRPDPLPDPDEEAVLDLLLDGLDPGERTALEARLAAEPALAATRDAVRRLLDAERRTFEPPLPAVVWEADAARVAARVRAEAAARETAGSRRRRSEDALAGGRKRGWARVLAFSVGLHVVALAVLAIFSGGGPEDADETRTHISFDADSMRPVEPDLAATEVAMRYEELVYQDYGSLMTDEILATEQEELADVLPEEAGVRRPGDGGQSLTHPVGVVVSMSRRRLAPVKRRRLHQLGFNANGTMRAVERGLRYLRSEQRRDGSFAPGGNRGALEQTALTMMAFLADGHCSRHREGDASGEAVARGIAWIRQQLDRPEVAQQSQDALGLATIALCEDYMLSYGWLSVAESQQRSNEIARMTQRLRADGTEETGAPAVVAPWRTWALDAAARAGIVRPTADDERAFQAWRVAAAAANGDLSERDAFGALAVSTALLYTEREAEKPRFKAWSEAHAESLVDRLGPIGKARSGDPIGGTAAVLLALQVAYRTY